MTTVSVIIPTYNRAHLVGRAIQSVLNQTYQDFELIVVDDASIDNTEEVIKELQQKDKRIIYIKHKKNKGGSSARNTGIKISKGKYIAFLDSDDELLPEYIQKQIEFFIKNNSQFVFCGREIINNKKKHFIINSKEYFTKNDLLWGNRIGGLSGIFIKSYIGKEVLFDEELTAAQDYDFYLRLLRKCDKAFNIPIVLVRVHETSNDRISDGFKKKYMGNKRCIIKHYKCMDQNQKKYHLFKYRLLEWSKNPNRNIKYFIKGLFIYPWWKDLSECKRVLGTIKKRFIA